MRAAFETLRIAVEIAMRNLLASRWKTLIVGGIIGAGALLLVVGTSLLDGIDRSMRQSIIGSISGHIQVYSAASKDDLEIMGNFYVDVPDIEPIDDFAKLRKTLMSVPNVADVVPMGFSDAIASSGNTVDRALESLRDTLQALRDHPDAAPVKQRYRAQKAHLRQVVRVLRGEIDSAQRISQRTAGQEELEATKRAVSDAFWDSFDDDPDEHLRFLDARVAPLAADADLLFLRYVGTDPRAFARAFDRMQIVDGGPIPPGERGFLFSKFVYEEQVKLRAAHGLDQIKAAIEERGATIAGDPELQRIVSDNQSGVNELLMQLDAAKVETFRQKLQAFLHSRQADVGKLLADFFATDDHNFFERYAFFYRELVPQLQLYRVRIGDTLTVKSVTRSGYIQAENLKVYGTYLFKGLEKSPQAGLINMMDLVSFRELYGFMTAERAKELKQMRAEAGAVDISREDAEAELFGSKPSAQPAAAPSSGTEDLSALRGTRTAREQATQRGYDPAQLERGPVLNAAVIVADESKIPETITAIEHAGKRAGLGLKAVSWQKAAGIIGQFASLMRAVLFAAVLIIFVVALVVINNALVMATLERVKEIGALRAIGAQRRFVLGMLVIESVVIGLLSGLLGAALGALLLLALHRVGIPAWNDVSTYIFSGPRLFPSLAPDQIAFALTTVILISLISGVYPAWLAMRVSPREAMHSDE